MRPDDDAGARDGLAPAAARASQHLAQAAARRAAGLRLIAFDVDGTLTDGRIFIGPAGEAMKAFSVRDGFGITLLREAGVKLAIVTARSSAIVELRAAELKFDEVLQGVKDKRAAFAELCARHGVAPDQAGFVGDDWPDLKAMAAAGFAASVADAPQAVRERAHWVTTARAGRGAVRELAEFVLESKGLLGPALARHAGEGA